MVIDTEVLQASVFISARQLNPSLIFEGIFMGTLSKNMLLDYGLQYKTLIVVINTAALYASTFVIA
jgi:hypothetical protein